MPKFFTKSCKFLYSYGFYSDFSILILNLKKTKRTQEPWVAHLRMSAHKVKEKHHVAHQTVLIMDLTALSIKPNMKLRLNDFSPPVPWQPRFFLSFSIFSYILS